MGIATGSQIGRYEVRSLIGEGGMGEVYLARDIRLGRTVALKILPVEIASDPKRIYRFVQEARAASALNHPNILTIYEIEQTGEAHYIATEFIEGVTLRDHLSRTRLSISETLDIAAQIASAIAAAHEVGVVHRDLKPENIMLRPDGLIKILDFGVAKVPTIEPNDEVDADADTLAFFNTQPGLLIGTVRYMSPEQARGATVDSRSDIWSLAIVLYEMLTQELPFSGPTNADTIAALIKNPTPLISDYRTDAPPELQQVITKALEKNPNNRYQTAKDLLVDLRRMQKRLDFDRFEGGPPTNLTTKATSPITETSLHPNNLSAPRMPIIGRAREIEEICTRLREGIRLLTLTGVGGTGKTTLAQAVAHKMLTEFEDGVFFIKLSAVSQAEFVAASFAQPLGVKESDRRVLIESLKDFLKPRKVLLIADNFEQVITARTLIAELLEAAPDLKFLLTSRELLHLSSESEYMVPPLALPETSILLTAAESSNYEAIMLFVERARALKPNFAVTDDNASSVLEICKRLDGLPLAIELAAARIKILSPEAILAKLGSRLQFLTGGAHDLPARQRTMRGAVDWSYELLTDDEKGLFCKLAVFAGGFTIDAATSVMASSGSEGSMIDVIDGVTSLVDKSLLVTREQADGEVRFRMLGVVREYALEHLDAGANADATRAAHAAYFLSLAEEAEPHLQGWQPAKWLNRLEEEHDNLRAALRWSVAHNVETAGRLAAAIRYFWNFQGYLTEGLRWSESVLNLGQDVPTAARWKILSMAGNLARFLGNHHTARDMYDEGLVEGRAVNDLSQISLACRGLAGLAMQQGDHDAARDFIEEALTAARQSDDQFGVARSLSMWGDLARTHGEDLTARALYQEALAICRTLGNQYAIGNILNNLAAAEYTLEEYEAALQHFLEALKMAQVSGGKIAGDKIAISYALDGFGAIAVTRQKLDVAAQLAAAAERLRDSINYKSEQPERRFREGYLTTAQSILSEADFATAYAKGRQLDLDQALSLALQECAELGPGSR
ncbi:MAG TPA: protein kinase [Pyrinomonadaceae bacterium]|nr:protein kinase [Pyrinomonadaceae bacterium]